MAESDWIMPSGRGLLLAHCCLRRHGPRRWSKAEPDGYHGGVAVSGPAADTLARYAADGVVVPQPRFDQDLRLGQRIEDLPVQELYH